MFKLHLEKKEFWDEKNSQFIYVGPDEPKDFKLEHSLVSVSKWESKFHKSYTNTEHKTLEETLEYIAMMVISEEDINPDWFKALTDIQINEINAYVNDPMTATTISGDSEKDKGNKSINGKITTNELIYYYMTALNIPFECQYWHLNHLITLIKVCSIESNPDKNKKKTKFSSADMASRKARMEAARAKYRK